MPVINLKVYRVWSIFVSIFFSVTVSLTNDTFKEDTASLSLQCVPKGVSSSDVKVTWMRDGKNLPTNGKYVIHAKKYTLVMNDPGIYGSA